MALYDGVPSIRLEGDEKRALALIPEGKALLYRMQLIMQRAGIRTFANAHRIDDDSYIYVLSAEGVNIISISVAPQVVEQTYPVPVSESYVVLPPTIYSGIVHNGYIEQQAIPSGTTSVCNEFIPTVDCAQNNKSDHLVADAAQRVPRLAVKPHNSLPELNNPDPVSPLVFSQYSLLRPSMYSGAMATVVQVLMGLGRIGKAALRDRFKVGEDTQYMRDVETSGVQVRYDYKFSRTHGITIGDDGKLWLVEVSITNGVRAMLLPAFPHLTGATVAAEFEQAGNKAMAAAIGTLNCLPTGEGFPTGQPLADKLASGDILQLLTSADMAGFYTSSGYSSSMGWAFNANGREASNTGYYFADDGVQRGVWYRVNIHIGAVRTTRAPGEPLAIATASVTKVREGKLWATWIGSAQFLPFKAHEPLLGGLLSHNGAPTISGRSVPPPMCDTPMFVAYIGDSINVVSFFRHSGLDDYSTLNDETAGVDCLLAGNWTITQTSGARSFPTMMYSNTYDDRAMLQANILTTDIVSEDFGYDNPRFSDYLEAPFAARVDRTRVFRKTTTVNNFSGELMGGVVAVPALTREAYYYATAHGYAHHYGSTTVSWDIIGDPNVGYSWRCFASLGVAAPYPDGRDCDPHNCGGDCTSGGIGVHRERRIICTNFEPTPCSDYADDGEWLSMCENVDNFNSLPPMPKPEPRSSFDLGEDVQAKLRFVCPSGTFEPTLTAANFANHWGRPSPDPDTGNVQLILATYSVIGDDGMVYSQGLSDYGLGTTSRGVIPGGPITTYYPCFIGVNGP
jgi:hypothetical protein